MVAFCLTMAVKLPKRRDTVALLGGIFIGVLISVLFSPSPQNCIALTKRILFSSEANISQYLTTPSEDTILELRKPLLVAVLVSDERSPRLTAIRDTWASSLTEVDYFPLRRITGDKAILPDFKQEDRSRISYRVLGQLFEKHGDRYNWYLIVGDDTYVRINATVQFLAGTSSDDETLVRPDGIARLKSKKSHLTFDRSCVPNSGYIYSRGLLKRISSAMEECQDDEGAAVYEKVAELDRCVVRKLAPRCVWNREIGQPFVDVAENPISLDEVSTGVLAINGLFNPTDLRKAHIFYIGLALNASEALTETLRQELTTQVKMIH